MWQTRKEPSWTSKMKCNTADKKLQSFSKNMWWIAVLTDFYFLSHDFQLWQELCKAELQNSNVIKFSHMKLSLNIQPIVILLFIDILWYYYSTCSNISIVSSQAVSGHILDHLGEGIYVDIVFLVQYMCVYVGAYVRIYVLRGWLRKSRDGKRSELFYSPLFVCLL